MTFRLSDPASEMYLTQRARRKTPTFETKLSVPTSVAYKFVVKKLCTNIFDHLVVEPAGASQTPPPHPPV